VPPRGPVRDLPSLTGLRAPAALVVFLTHCAVFVSPLIPVFGIASLGYVGVTFFFAISGAVLAWSNPTPARTAFWWRRFTRIYPVHIATTAFALLVHRGQDVIPVLASILLVQTWWPAWHEAGNLVSWSLCCEAFFYAIFPWLMLTLGRVSARSQWTLGAAFYTVMSVVLVAAALLSPSRVDDSLHWFPVSNTAPFVLGVIVGLRLRDGWRPRVPLATAWLVAVFAAVVAVTIRLAQAGPSSTGLVLTILTPAFVLLIAAHAAADVSGRRTIFAHPVLVYAGKVSFAFYLVHYTLITLVIVNLGHAPTTARGALLAVVLLFGLSGAAAAGLHHGIELPARRRLLRWSTGRSRESV
jgi:peptidoglycan/LPS O-acetylase OafA/YrhL